MELLEYPLDINQILRKKKGIKKKLIEEDKEFINKKIAILGGSTTSEIKNILELFLLESGIKADFYESDYNKYFEEIMFSKELREFNPDIIYIHTTMKNLKNMPDVNNSQQDVDKKIQDEYSQWESMWEVLKEGLGCIVIQNNFEYPKNRNLGNLDGTTYYGITKYISQLNLRMCKYQEQNKNFIINDINYLSASIGLDKWYDSTLWYSYKYAMSYEGICNLSKSLSNIIKSIYGKSKKCLVLDLDNTLWGGVVGDDGVDSLKIGKETAIGEAYLEFQKYISELRKRGITLAIASKNEENIARLGLQHPQMYLKESDFTSIKANWEPKYINIYNISKEINIGLDSLVFIDDNPSEREIVKSQTPQVEVPNIGENIISYIDYIDKNGYFEIVGISKEDVQRNDYYQSNILREKSSSKFNNYDEFLSSLNMVGEIQFFKTIYLERIAQLTNKTNQFNLTTKRYTLQEIENINKSDEFIKLYCRLKDKFGDNGLISVIIGKIEKKTLHIDLWLMSCRVLKRDVEKAMFDKLIDACKEKEIVEIHGYYYKTQKNSIVENHYAQLGFENINKSEYSSEWQLHVKSVENKLNKFIEDREY